MTTNGQASLHNALFLPLFLSEVLVKLILML